MSFIDDPFALLLKPISDLVEFAGGEKARVDKVANDVGDLEKKFASIVADLEAKVMDEIKSLAAAAKPAADALGVQVSSLVGTAAAAAAGAAIAAAAPAVETAVAGAIAAL